MVVKYQVINIKLTEEGVNESYLKCVTEEPIHEDRRINQPVELNVENKGLFHCKNG